MSPREEGPALKLPSFARPRRQRTSRASAAAPSRGAPNSFLVWWWRFFSTAFGMESSSTSTSVQNAERHAVLFAFNASRERFRFASAFDP